MCTSPAGQALNNHEGKAPKYLSKSQCNKSFD
ncbi:DUF1190 domain-containing protein [Shewanella insulae]